MKELIKRFGPQFAKLVFAAVVEIVATVGAEAATKYLKRKYKINIDKSVFEQALRTMKG